ncbi:MAG: hypothetical protein AAB276_06590 [Pseudomonadota bacterium]
MTGGKSSSSSDSSQTTTTRDERIAASDSAVVLKDALNNLTNITFTDAGSFELGKVALESNKAIAIAAIDTIGNDFSTSLDKTLQFLKTASEKTTTDTTGAQKLMPWMMGGVAVIALSQALKR